MGEIVEDGLTGLLFEPGNVSELAEKIRLLWENSDLSGILGRAGRAKALREFKESIYYEELKNVYEKAIQINAEKKL